MNLGLILALLAAVSLFKSVDALNNSNPECQDLKNLQKKLSDNVAKIPTGKVDCKPNSNCTGMICSGKIAGKSFHGISIVLEGCKDPVRMVVHTNKGSVTVKNGFHRRVKSTVDVSVNLHKIEQNTVLVTVTAKVCAFGTVCHKYKILDDQAIRVRCNDSTLPSIQSSRYPSLASKSPECKGLEKTKTQVENHFGLIKPLYPDAEISCTSENNCSDLKCSGVANKDRFNSTATVEYCSNPVKLRLVIDIPRKKQHIDHTFEDGQSFKLMNFIPVKVDLKRVGNSIYLSVYVEFSLAIFKKDIYLVRNISIAIDPSHCPGHYVPPMVVHHSSHHTVHSRSKSLSSGAIAGVVIAAIVFFVLVIALILWIVRGKRQKIARYNDLAMNDDTDPLYFDSDPIA